MVSAPLTNLSRRSALRAGGVAALALVLPACATYPGYSLTEAVRRLLLQASENAFYRLTEPGGYWDERIASAGLGDTLGVRGDAACAKGAAARQVGRGGRDHGQIPFALFRMRTSASMLGSR